MHSQILKHVQCKLLVSFSSRHPARFSPAASFACNSQVIGGAVARGVYICLGSVWISLSQRLSPCKHQRDRCLPKISTYVIFFTFYR